MMEIRYRCPFTGQIILTIDDYSTLRVIGNTTPCPTCKTSHPIMICPKEVVKE